MDELNKRIKDLNGNVAKAAERLGLAKLSAELNVLRQKMQMPDFWSDNKIAQTVAKREAELSRRIGPWVELQNTAAELEELSNMGDSSITLEIASQLERAEDKFAELRKDLNFSGTYDSHNVIMNIYAGAGGTDAQDWAQMLLRMYVRWAEDHGLKVQTVEQSPGDEAGIKSATIEISGGNYLYGKLAGEHGVHRLVRKSPFNAAGSRETSFARVEVLPVMDAPDEVRLDDSDLRIDVFRAGGHGGQSVNTTDSAVRVTHIPTGIVVSIQNERSQLQNKETALTILRSRLAQMQLEQHADKLEDLRGPDKSNEWGSQIRNYILDDRIVKDLRTGFESHDPAKILDGGLDPLIDAYLES